MNPYLVTSGGSEGEAPQLFFHRLGMNSLRATTHTLMPDVQHQAHSIGPEYLKCIIVSY